MDQVVKNSDSIEKLEKTMGVLHTVLNYILTTVMMLIENETISCTETEQSLKTKEPGVPISITRVQPNNSTIPPKFNPTIDFESHITGIIYRGIFMKIPSYIGGKYKRRDLLKIRKNLLAKCREIISNNIKLEEPINFAKFFQEALLDIQSPIKNDDKTTEEKLMINLPVQTSERVGNSKEIRKSAKNSSTTIIASDRKIRTRTLHINQVVTLEDKGAQSFVETPSAIDFSVRFPSIDNRKESTSNK